VTNRNSQSVSRVNPTTNRVFKTYRLPGTQPAGVTRAGGAIWVGDEHGSAVYRIDPRTNRVRKVPTGHPSASWLATSGNAVWISNTVADTVTRLDPATGKITAVVEVGLSPVNLESSAARCGFRTTPATRSRGSTSPPLA
jgi:YVTN family beta-propeller protein